MFHPAKWWVAVIVAFLAAIPVQSRAQFGRGGGGPSPGPSMPSPGGYRPSSPGPSHNYGGRPQPGYPGGSGHPGGPGYRDPTQPNYPGQSGRPGHPNHPGQPGYPGQQPSPWNPMNPQAPGSFHNPLSFHPRTPEPSLPEVVSRVPIGVAPVPDAQWERSQQLLRQGQFDQARQAIDAAMGKDRSLGTMMWTVSAMEQAHAPQATVDIYRQQALQMAHNATQHGPGSDPMPWTAIARLSLQANNDAEFRRASATLQQHFPGQMHTHYFAGIEAVKDGNWKKAEQELRTARKLGMSEQDIGELLKLAIDRQRWVWVYAGYVGCALAAWFVGLGLLYFVGKMLSSATLRAVRKKHVEAVSPLQRMIRRFYRIVVNLAGYYYYISLPMVVVLSLALPLSIGYALLMLPVLNIFLVIAVFVLSIGSLWTAVTGIRAAFVRVKDEDPGLAVRPEEAPALWQFVREVAEKVGTRPVDQIWLTTGTDFAVFERGSFRQRLRDRGRRALILGAGVLEGMGQNALRAVLAHEYGHFLHRDTAGGDVAWRVRLAIIHFAEALAQRDKIRRWDVAFQFLRFYDFLFRRLTFGATRLQEVLADRIAALAYGADAFRDGLVHTIRRAIEFDHLGSTVFANALRTGQQPASFYRVPLYVPIDRREEIEQVIERLLNQPSNEDNTHPGPQERFALIKGLGPETSPDEDRPAWDLFSDRDSWIRTLEEKLSQMLKAGLEEARQSHRAMIKGLSQLIAQIPSPDAFHKRASLRSALGEHRAALADLNQALQRSPDAYRLVIARAFVHMELKDYAAASDDVQRVMREVPDSRGYDAYMLLSEIHHRLGQYEQAVATYSWALKERDTSIAALVGRAGAYRELGNLAPALDDLALALERCPRYADAWCERGLVRQAQGDYASALADLNRAIELEPGFAEGRARLAWLLTTCPDAQFRNCPQAAEHARLAHELAPDSGMAIEALAAVTAAQGDHERAAQLAREAMPLLPPEKQAACEARMQLYLADRQ